MRKNYFLQNIFIACILFFSTEFIKATVIAVPANFSTIQSAINASSNGDTVAVSPGTYFENINLRGKKIVLTSLFYLSKDTAYILNTVIDGSTPLHADTATCIIINHGEDSTTVIQGFTLTGGAGTKWTDVHGAGTYREGGGIIVEFSSPIIQYNIICNNFVTNISGVSSTGGGGIRCGDSNPIIRNNRISNNAGRYGGGIVFNYSTGLVKNNLICNNAGGQSYGGGGIWLTGTDTNTVVNIVNNTIANNHVTGSGTDGGKGGAVFVFNVKADLRNNIVWGNTQNSAVPFATYFGGVIRAAYSDIQNAWPGTANTNVNPLFADTINFLLSSLSPCIDGGDTALQYNDNFSAPNNAVFPSVGTKTNDMGVYGGSGAKLLPACAFNTVGIENVSINKSDVIVFPNPAQQEINIVLNVANENSANISLYDNSMRCVRSSTQKNLVNGKNSFKFSLNEVNAGIYFLMIRTGNKTVCEKVIVQ